MARMVYCAEWTALYPETNCYLQTKRYYGKKLLVCHVTFSLFYFQKYAEAYCRAEVINFFLYKPQLLYCKIICSSSQAVIIPDFRHFSFPLFKSINAGTLLIW